MSHTLATRIAPALLGAVVLAATGVTARAVAGPVVVHPTAVHRVAAHVSPHVSGRHRRHAGGRQQSLNWAGYIHAGSFSAATGTWTVPTLATGQDGYSSTWVGIDGATSGDRYLIQTGTEADVSAGRRSYRAWWEVITAQDVAPETVFRTVSVHPGDTVTASVARTGTGRWTMLLRDVTTGAGASHTASFDGPGSSVEWIQEDTDVDGRISTAPDWGSVSFRQLTADGRSPHLIAAEAVDIVDRAGTREARTGAPTAHGSGFTVTWLAAGTPTAAERRR